jgi:hypothetical protein
MSGGVVLAHSTAERDSFLSAMDSFSAAIRSNTHLCGS